MTAPTAPTVWDYARLAALAEGVESNIANLAGPADLLPAYKVARLALDPHVKRAWADVAPAAAALRKFGDCRETILLRKIAEDDLNRPLSDLPEPSQPTKQLSNP